MKSYMLLMTIVLQNVFITINTEKSKLGISPCMYSGDYDIDGYYCPDIPMPLYWIPEECTSFVYDGLLLLSDDNTVDSLYEDDENNLVALIATKKPLYLYLGYDSPKSWIESLYRRDYTADAQSVKTFLETHKVTGVILKNLNNDYNDNSDFQFDDKLNYKLKSYVSTMTSINHGLQVGLYVNASNMIFYEDNPTSENWFNFEILNDVMQYYIITFDRFNRCKNSFKGGIVPLNNIGKSTHSLKSFEVALSSSTIAKDKIYLEYMASPTPNDTTTEYLPTCCVSYKKFCESDNYDNFWCADTAKSFFEKGQFAKEIKAQGFVTKYIDTSDPTGQCDCDSKNKFLTFAMMLRGFKDLDPITDCEKLTPFVVSETYS